MLGYFTNRSFSTHAPKEKILDQPIFLNTTQQTRVSIASHTGIFQTNLPSLETFSTTSDEKVGFPIANHERIYKLILDSIPIAWKHLIRTVLLKNLF